MKFDLPKIYPLTDLNNAQLSHFQQVEQFISNGCKFVQIREKEAGSRIFLEQAERSVEYARQFGAKIIINDRVDIAKIAGADGVHLGQDDISPIDARSILGESAIIGFSTHTLEQVKAALALPIDYIAFGPIFTTTTKPDAEAVTGLESLKEVKRIAGSIPLVAIGGIDPDNADDVLKAGADSLAIISYFSKNSSNLNAAFKELNIRAKLFV